MAATIRCSSLGGDLSAPKTPITPTLANRHERPPGAHVGTKNKQPHTNTQVQKLQTLKHCFKPYAFVCRYGARGVIRVGAYYNFYPGTISRAAVLVSAGIYPGMILCESLPCGMVDITIVGCLAHLFRLAHD